MSLAFELECLGIWKLFLEFKDWKNRAQFWVVIIIDGSVSFVVSVFLNIWKLVS